MTKKNKIVVGSIIGGVVVLGGIGAVINGNNNLPEDKIFTVNELCTECKNDDSFDLHHRDEVVTVSATIENDRDISFGTLHLYSTVEHDTYSSNYSLLCKFDNASYIEHLGAGDEIVLSGSLNGVLTTSITLKECTLISYTDNSVETVEKSNDESLDTEEQATPMEEEVEIFDELSLDEFIKLDNLPKYYGSLSDAESFYNQISDDVLKIYGNKKDDIINQSITLNFEKAGLEVNFEEAFDYINNFLSQEILDKHYEISTTKIFTKDEHSWIIVKYNIRVEEELDNNNYYGHTFYEIYELNNSTCLNASIKKDTERWMSYPEKNGYDVEVYPLPNDISITSKTAPTEEVPEATTPATTTTAVTTTTAPPATEPTQSNEITLVSMANPLRRNEDAAITIQGAPNTEYQIAVYYSSGKSTAEGLENKYSDSNGIVSWTWHVGGKTNLGDNKRIKITGGGKTYETTFSVVD